MGKPKKCGRRSPSSSSTSANLRQHIVSSKIDVAAVSDHLRHNKTLANDDDDDKNEDQCRKTTMRKADESEERLLAAESDRVLKQRLRKDRNPNPSSVVSTDDLTFTLESGDAVKIDPEFDAGNIDPED